MDEIKSRVYIKIDENNRVTQIEGEYSLQNFSDLSECILIEEGTPCDRLNHAQNHYLEKSLRDERGLLRYKYENNEIVERSQEEIDADYIAPVVSPSAEERLEALEALMLESMLGGN